MNFNSNKMTISSTGKDMFVQFLTDDYGTEKGFKAYFHYIPIKPNCANWLNMTAQLLKSPDYPTIDCSWVITAPTIYNTIIIHFETFDVKLHLILDLHLLKQLFKNFLAWECLFEIL